ncbi:MAG TPA: post-COAP-1 domain-containing protein [Pyrinomonadaceae bacterium]|nr:post-COAP-1 domain-containing protein [Pyrinomonadaceae bacterium]
MNTKLRVFSLFAVAFFMALTGRVGHTQSAASLVRGPYLQSGTPTSIVVRWRTDIPADSQVRYGPAPDALSSSSLDPAPTTEHEVVLSGLSPSTRYCYSVGSSSQVLSGGDDAHCFETAPPVGTSSPVRIWAFGDAGFADDSQRAVRDAYLNFAGGRRTNVWLMLGDNAYFNGTDAEYQAAVFDMYPSLLKSTVLWSTFGNHEAFSSDSPSQSGPYYDAFTFPTKGEAGGAASGTEAYYSFDYANIHFVSLDSDDTPRGTSDRMLTWLREDLSGNTQDWTIVMFHHPPYSKGSHDSDNAADSGGRMMEMRENAMPIIEEFGVDLVLTGHSHSYERSFLLDGHDGTSDTLSEAMKKDPGDGRAIGDRAYFRPDDVTLDGNAGTIHAVVGTGGQPGFGPFFNHPVMVTGFPALGSLVLDVSGPRLDGQFIDTRGVVRDSFAIEKAAASPAVPKQRPIADDPEPDQSEGVDHDGAYSVNWTYSAPPTEQPCGLRVDESRLVLQAFHDDAGEPLIVGSNSTWQGDSAWTSGPHPGTATTGYWLPYTDGVDTVLTMKSAVVIPANRAAVLTFASYEEIEERFDYGFVEASVDGGRFQTLATYTGIFHGVRSIDLSGFAGKSVTIRFRLASDFLVSFPIQPGWFIDDIQIRTGVFSTVGGVDGSTGQFDVSGRSGGIYGYRVAGLFGNCADSPTAGTLSRVRLITVAAAPLTAEPTASFTATPNPANVGQPVFFDGSASHDNDTEGPAPEIVNYFWSFGDGAIQSTTGAVTFHSYGSPGIYRATLTVRDNDGGSATEEMFVVVTLPTGPTAHSASGYGSFQFSGMKASFGFSVESSAQGSSGHLEYHDRANRLKVDITEITSLVVTGNQATFSGPCRINKTSGFDCVVDVVDNGEPGSTDTFRIRINNEYDAEGTLEIGNIKVR